MVHDEADVADKDAVEVGRLHLLGIAANEAVVAGDQRAVPLEDRAMASTDNA